MLSSPAATAPTADRPRPGPRRPVVLGLLLLLLLVVAAVSNRVADDRPGDRVVTADVDRPRVETTGAARSGQGAPARPDPTRPEPDPTTSLAPRPVSAVTPTRQGAAGARAGSRPPATSGAWLRSRSGSAPGGAGPGRTATTDPDAPADPSPSTSTPGTPATTPVAPSTTTTSTPPPATTTTTTPEAGPGLAPDQRNCPNLGLVAIGDATGSPAPVARLGPLFRAQAAATQRPDALVCALPLEAWRDDLVIQRLRAAGEPAGLLVAGLDGTRAALWLSDVEWTSFAFRSGNHNFAGIPVARLRIGGVEVIRTTRGGLVMERADTWGNVVLGGAWDVWLQRGGPTGEMGLPRSKPTGWIGIGAYQDFDGGHLLLPGVTTDLEAETRGAGEYQWHPATVDPSPAARPKPNSIVKVTGTSYYVDPQGIRHWIVSGSDWSCATHDLGAREVEVRGWVVGLYPLGPTFVCPGR